MSKYHLICSCIVCKRAITVQSIKLHYNTHIRNNISYGNCKHCFAELPYTHRNNLFCNRSCAATFNNYKKLKKLKLCKCCGLKIPVVGTFCNHKCQTKYTYNLYISEWKQGLHQGHYNNRNVTLNNYIRKYITLKYNDQCARCGWQEVNQTSGKKPLQVDHMDGNVYNTTEDNLILLCPNCHSLTPTYGALNKGNGRRGKC